MDGKASNGVEWEIFRRYNDTTRSIQTGESG